MEDCITRNRMYRSGMRGNMYGSGDTSEVVQDASIRGFQWKSSKESGGRG
jgi:hypothetical protein